MGKLPKKRIVRSPIDLIPDFKRHQIKGICRRCGTSIEKIPAWLLEKPLEQIENRLKPPVSPKTLPSDIYAKVKALVSARRQTDKEIAISLKQEGIEVLPKDVSRVRAQQGLRSLRSKTPPDALELARRLISENKLPEQIMEKMQMAGHKVSLAAIKRLRPKKNLPFRHPHALRPELVARANALIKKRVHNDTFIARKLKISQNAVRNLRKKLCLPPVSGSGRRLPPNVVSKVKELLLERKFNDVAIVGMLRKDGISVSSPSVRNLRKTLNLPPVSRIGKRLPPVVIKRAKQPIQKGKNARKIVKIKAAKSKSISKPTISKLDKPAKGLKTAVAFKPGRAKTRGFPGRVELKIRFGKMPLGALLKNLDQLIGAKAELDRAQQLPKTGSLAEKQTQVETLIEAIIEQLRVTKEGRQALKERFH